MDYLELIKKEYNTSFHDYNKYDFLNELFSFAVYEADIEKQMVKDMVEVLRAILNGETYEYIKSPSRHKKYIHMVNTPFLHDKLDWGTSVRGAWLDNCKEYYIELLDIEIGEGELTKLIKALIEWYDYLPR